MPQLAQPAALQAGRGTAAAPASAASATAATLVFHSAVACFMLSHWVNVSAGNPAIAVARKVGVLGAPEIENGSNMGPNLAPFCFF